MELHFIVSNNYTGSLKLLKIILQVVSEGIIIVEYQQQGSEVDELTECIVPSKAGIPVFRIYYLIKTATLHFRKVN